MRIVLINVPHPAIGSRIPREQLPPLGLLSVGGPLIDDGHDVTMIDGEFGPMPIADLVAAVIRQAPDAVLFGHSGSSLLAMERMPPWRLFLWVKAIEAIAQLRPRSLRRLAWNPDPRIRHAIRWYYRMGLRVWIHEILGFLFRDGRSDDGRTVEDHFGETQDHEEEASAIARRLDRALTPSA